MSERQPPFVPRQVPRQPYTPPPEEAPPGDPGPGVPPAEAPAPVGPAPVGPTQPAPEPLPDPAPVPPVEPTPAPAPAPAPEPAPAGAPTGPLRRAGFAHAQPSPAPSGSAPSQDAWRVRFDWGIDGLRAVAPDCRAVVIVDVLRFSTLVDVAATAGVAVVPYLWGPDPSAFAQKHGAQLIGPRRDGRSPLSPVAMLDVPRGTRVVVPSPNGATLALEAANMGIPNVFMACLRNASAVTEAAAKAASGGGKIAVIAAGERWGGPDGRLRPAVEDMLGAGAMIEALDPSACSPEARAAAAAFREARSEVAMWLRTSASGEELMAQGWGDEVEMASELDVSTMAPVLWDWAFVPAADHP